MNTRIGHSLASKFILPMLLFLLGLGLGGCSTTGKYAPAPTASAASADYSYVIGPGDTINITVWRNPELSMSVPVRPDGKISTPLVQDLVAVDGDE